MADSFLLSEKLATDLNKVIPFVEGISLKIAALTGLEEKALQVKLALEESLTNAMRHGNKLEPQRLVNVSIDANSERVILDIHDEGNGFDVENIPDPTRRDLRDVPSGRGIFLIQKLMDRVEFYDKGSGVKMIKFFSQKS